MADSKEKLFSDFSPVSTQEWMDKITVDLKGADFEKKLVWRTNEGFKVKPFYRQEDLEGLKTTEGLPGQYPYIRGIKKDDNTWFIRQDITVNDAAEANAKALDTRIPYQSQRTQCRIPRYFAERHLLRMCGTELLYLPASYAATGTTAGSLFPEKMICT